MAFSPSAAPGRRGPGRNDISLPLEAALSNLERIRTSLRGGGEDGDYSPYGPGSGDPTGVTPSQGLWGQPPARPTRLRTTTKPVALYLKEMQVNESFDFKWPFFGDDMNELRVLGVAWDLSGRPPFIFAPDLGSGPYFRARPQEPVTFLGDGLQVWPSSTVTGGLNVRILLVESDAENRVAVEDLDRVKAAVDQSGLVPALKDVGAAANPASAVAVEAASAGLNLALMHLANNRDDHVALFEGTYGAESLEHRSGETVETHDRPGASIKLLMRVDGAESFA